MSAGEGYGAISAYYSGETDRQISEALKQNLNIAARDDGWVTTTDGRRILVTNANKDSLFDQVQNKTLSIQSVGRPGSTAGKIFKSIVIAGIAAGAGAVALSALSPAAAAGTGAVTGAAGPTGLITTLP